MVEEEKARSSGLLDKEKDAIIEEFTKQQEQLGRRCMCSNSCMKCDENGNITDKFVQGEHKNFYSSLCISKTGGRQSWNR